MGRAAEAATLAKATPPLLQESPLESVPRSSEKKDDSSTGTAGGKTIAEALAVSGSLRSLNLDSTACQANTATSYAAALSRQGICGITHYQQRQNDMSFGCIPSTTWT